MAEKDTQLGMIVLVFATLFLLSGLEMLTFRLFDQEFSTFIAFILVAVGVYMIAKK